VNRSRPFLINRGSTPLGWGRPSVDQVKRLAAAAGVAVVLLAGAPLTAAAQPPASPTVPGATAPVPAAPSPITVTLNSMSPRSPDARKLTQVVTFVATLTNNTDTAYSGLRVTLERSVPIVQQSQLDAAISTPPATDTITARTDDVPGPLPARGTLTVTYKTTPDHEPDMCLCQTGVYPYALVVRGKTTPDGPTDEIGRTQILVPSFPPDGPQPQPVSVAWVWPLLSRPHRAMSANVFTDDGLAGEISPGGRLDRALKVAELTQDKVRMTLVVDPDLLDSLSVMASAEPYQVVSGATTVAGAGHTLAIGWLNRLKNLQTKHDLVMTAYADPDINAVTRAGLKWSTALDPQVQARLAPSFINYTSDLTWPADGVLTGNALDAAVAGGSATVLLSDTALPGQNNTEPRPDGVSPLPTATGKATALVTDSTLQKLAAQIFTLGALPATNQQALLAQLAIRAAQDPTVKHFAVITPGRYVDTDPVSAASTILSLVGTSWSSTMDARTAASTVAPVDRGALQIPADAPAAELSPSDMSSLRETVQRVASLRSALDNADASALLGGFNAAVQRAESTAWRTDRNTGAARVAQLQTRSTELTDQVHLAQPTTNKYSLSSSNSPIQVTVINDLDRPVTVRVTVSPGRGAVGFVSEPVEIARMPAHSRRPVSIPVRVSRVDKFNVVAGLSTPDGGTLGVPVELSVRVTALGGITKTVTGVAAAVLVIALLRRFVLRIRRGHSGHQTGTVGAQ
jgi:hypothetical protein